MIHRYALATRTLPSQMHEVLNDVVEMINYIKRSATNTRLFRALCQDLSAVHENLLFYTQVRWLFAGNMLRRFQKLTKELLIFFQQDTGAKAKCFAERLSDNVWLLRLCYLSDIFDRINAVNRSMQGSNTTVLQFIDIISSFLAKLRLWHDNASEGNFAMFDCLFQVTQHSNMESVMSVQGEICQHLQSLNAEVSMYLPEIDDIYY